MIPAFDEYGNLPPGMHAATWEEIVDRFGRTPHRRRLLVGLGNALAALAVAGCRRVYLNGSFVTAKPQPIDYDGCWEIDGVDSTVIDSVFLGADSPARQTARYGGALYPVNALVDPGWEFMLDWFQHDRDGNRKGLIVLDPRSIQP
jgi:hypothetical protein